MGCTCKQMRISGQLFSLAVIFACAALVLGGHLADGWGLWTCRIMTAFALLYNIGISATAFMGRKG